MEISALFPTIDQRSGDLLVDADSLLGVLRRASQLLKWEGSGILPEGPEEALIDYMAGHRSAAGPLVLALLHTFRRLYGAGPTRVLKQVDRYLNAVEQFVRHFGSGPLALGRAPARINILGEHVDYVRYLPTEVLPFASREHDMLILFRPVDEPRVRGRSTLEGTAPAAFELSDGPAPDTHAGKELEARWLAYLHEAGIPARDWSNYIKASVFFCAMKHPGLTCGFDFLLDSTIPSAGGASSSSTLVVLAGAAIRLANGLAFDPESLAEDSAKAEWYVGTRGGNMDHCTMCLSRRQHALHLNFSPFRTELVPLHRFRYRWVTFFAHEADKSGAVLLEYNERSAVSRLLIPAYLERLLAERPDARQRWTQAVTTLAEDTADLAAAEAAMRILEDLPESVTLDAVKRDFPAVHAELERSYPRLADGTRGRPLLLRARALHHAGEVVRVRKAVRILNELFASRMPEEPEKTEPGLRAVGDLITECHESMRELYNLTTPDIDALLDIILSHPGVYGARLMGGGFGGNILVLASKEHVAELVDQVQSRFYTPRLRDAVAEGSIMVSTPGEGFGLLCLHDVLLQAVINASAVWWNWPAYAAVVEQAVCELLGITRLAAFTPQRAVQPLIVAAGRGEPRRDGDYRTPSSLNVLAGKTALEHVIATVRRLPFETRPPILVVSPGMSAEALDAVPLPAGTRVAVQPKPLGTGHAVRAALDRIPAEDADVLVVWGSQPLLSPATLTLSVAVHQALGSRAMLFPTAVTRTPYAPIQRNLRGYVVASYETKSGDAPTRRLGETNVGAFVLSAAALRETLAAVHEELWDADADRYRTRTGELGFPNEMARALVQRGKPVIALPIARVEESLGLRTREGFEEARRIMEAGPPG
ncbi:MAG: hypothetical protein JXR37_22145 [Kiritimatiellae bacterium]|nr:hypothetical protein [Kiritimatiellia bacterium]